MPRQRPVARPAVGHSAAERPLIDALANELKTDSALVQPMIVEEEFHPTESLRADVIWDAWEKVDPERRVDIIMEAYRRVEPDRAEKLALASGHTVAEAVELGLLPFQVIPLCRSGDAVTIDQCETAMRTVGASTVDGRVTLRFPNIEWADRCVAELKRLLPRSGEVWSVSQEIGYDLVRA